jgi:adenosylhomocysteine nucleosidase
VVAVLTALQLEHSAVRAHLTDLAERPAGGTIFEVGDLPGASVRVALAVGDEGNTAAAVLAERAIAVFRPESTDSGVMIEMYR